MKFGELGQGYPKTLEVKKILRYGMKISIISTKEELGVIL